VIDRPGVRYAPTEGGFIAYQRFGEGAIDVAYIHGIASNLDAWWDYRPAAEYFREWGTFSRLVVHDRRGTGLSDAHAGYADLETRIKDLLAVLDHAGIDRAAFYGIYDGGMVGALFAATYPERARSLLWYSPTARAAYAPDHPWGATEAEMAELIEGIEASWGSEEHAKRSMLHAGIDPGEVPGLAAFTARMNRAACGPATARAFYQALTECDVRAALPAIRVPTLLIDRESFDDRERAEAEDVQARIPGARLVRLPPGPKTTLADPRPILDAVRSFLGVTPAPAATDAVLATLLFTDIVDSTRLQAEFGDQRWKALAEQHHAAVRAILEANGGVEQDTAGDGFYARFSGPARAIRSAIEAAAAVRPLGIQIRAGVHAGECEIVDGKCSGLSVSIGARVMSHARPSEVLVSQTVKDLVAGSGLSFEDAGEHELKGVPDRWRLYRVVTA
jgi:class 3 adenylate cyclase